MLHEYDAGGTATELWQLQHRLKTVMRYTRHLTERERIDLGHMGERLGAVARKLHDRQQQIDSCTGGKGVSRA